jgi:thiol-disulfide isomerase/thioredoxin
MKMTAGFTTAVAAGVLLVCTALAAEQRPQLTGEKGDGKYFMYPSLAKDLLSPEQSADEQARADAAWARLFEPVDGYEMEFVNEEGKPSNLTLGDHLRRKQPGYQRDPKEIYRDYRGRAAFRERGMKFSEEFPKDVRRHIWLYATMEGLKPSYWQDIDQGARAFSAWLYDRSSRVLSTVPLDKKARAQWETRYIGLRSDFLASAVLQPDAKCALQRIELDNRMFWELQDNKIPDSVTEDERALIWTEFIQDSLDYHARCPGLTGYLPNNILYMLEEGEQAHPKYFLLLKEQFLAAAKVHSSDKLKDFAMFAAAEPVELEVGKPVPALSFRTIKNRDVDRSVLQGKVVLIDFWAFWCGACIEGMPQIKKLHDKYRADGLEVYSVCFGEKDETAKQVTELMGKMDITWEQSLRESLRSDRLARIYSFTSLPQLLLLDRDGNLAARNLHNPAQLEAKIRELLGKG